MTPFSRPPSKTTHLVLIGTGLIGTALLGQLAAAKRPELSLIGLANSKRMVWKRTGIPLRSWQQQLAAGQVMEIDRLIAEARRLGVPRCVVVDCTASDEVAARYVQILKSGISILTPNKKANAGSFATYQQVREVARGSGAKFLYETNVGAGLPVIQTLQDMIATGDRIVKIEGVFSGTLSFLFNSFTGATSFSQLVARARQLGYTEPDPRDDLSGLDVARKLLILAREVGRTLELDDITVENLTPQSCRTAATVDEFFSRLEQTNGQFEARRHAAAKRGKVLRYVASLHGQTARVRLQAVAETHPAAQLQGSENIFIITTQRYRKYPLVIRGPGAGAEVTAAGVFADILRI